MPTGQTAVQHGCNGMDGKGKGDGEIDKKVDPFGWRHLFSFCRENDPATENVQKQVAHEHTHIPKHHGIRSFRRIYAG